VIAPSTTGKYFVHISKTDLAESSKTDFLVLTKWDDVDKANIEKLTSLNRPVVKIQAIHTYGVYNISRIAHSMKEYICFFYYKFQQ
jgi:hypothetical protein